MSKKIYVGNLSYQTTEGDLTTLFEQVGQVDSVNVITDRDTGRSKGFAFVEMSNEDADKAITQFNGTEVNGQRVTETSLMNGDVIGVGTTRITFERRVG